ncbi:unnamed protein product [Penicillium olsonii]|uniref:Endonuclease/exonuclease/phosphatase domain-containing protein n=1 Tax=Penicillium olsonii TaxID=99116 RepID=A0A9W4HD08_PENOL|nr:unnamed protein product [Penicillium olsonii]CAG7972653.1 unnamed protein product [Penicillium olsonii]
MPNSPTMNFLKSARMSFISWMHETPLPSTGSIAAYPEFQSWHQFDPVQQWVSWAPTHLDNASLKPNNAESTSNLVLLTWNIDATSSQTQQRVVEIITFITNLDAKVDVIFFQEVSKPALQYILEDERIRESWISSECDDTAWGRQSFTTITLMSKTRFGRDADSGTNKAILGPVWRVKYPSRFDRDALCCDTFVPSSNSKPGSKSSSATRIRLVNVHLDSLPIQPSRRPQQISIASSYLRAAGCGVVAGDFNPVLEEDGILIDKNGLTDAWVALHSQDPGYTWGVDGQQPFPPNRLDRVAVLGLTPSSIEVLPPGQLTTLHSGSEQDKPSEDVPWNDQQSLTSVQTPSIDDIASLASLLQDAEIPSALWGVNAAGCYGGGLCPLIVINEADQTRVFELLRSHGCRPSQPLPGNPPSEFETWRDLALHHEYQDRRRLRPCIPMYELPETGDEFVDAFLPFIVVCSAESVGLPKIPPLSLIKTHSQGEQKDVAQRDVDSLYQEQRNTQGYVLLSDLPYYILGSHESHSSLLVPEFHLLVQSILHALLQLPEHTPRWAQFMAELSELLRSPGCVKGPDSLHEVVKPSQLRFAKWVQHALGGKSENTELRSIRDEYRDACHSDET